MTRAVVLSAVRTPVGRYGGGLAGVRPDDLAAIAVAAAVERAGVPAGEIEDVWLGCANQAGEDNRNVARFAALLAGLPESVAGVTVNRLCASGLSAVVGACHAVIAGDGDLFVAGGVESMTRAPLVTAKPDAPYARGNRTIYDTTLGWRFTNPRYEERFSSESMGETGENVAERWAVSREDQDAFALRSQQRWAEADAAGRFADELVPGRRARARRAPAPGHHRGEDRVAEARLPLRGDGHGRERERDQRRRGGARDRERGAGAFARRGAARSVRRLGGRRRRPRGHGHRPGARRPQAARAGGLTAADLDLVELNEAFASQSLAVVRELGIDEERVNVNGGAIAIGHPLGMSGARLVVTLLHELRRRGGRYGLATMCVGVGQGQAALFERPA